MSEAPDALNFTVEGDISDVDGEDIYHCHVCFEEMISREPRTLRCNQSFCTECIKRIYDQTPGHVVCPDCRLETPVPSGDVTALPRNFTLQKTKEREKKLLKDQQQRAVQMAQIQQAALVTIQVMLCEVCNRDDPISKCEECKEKMCLKCTENHNKVPAFANHNILMLCSMHKTSLCLICHRCVKAICQKCVLLEHGDHGEETENIADGVAKLRKEFAELGNKLTTELKKMNGHTLHIERKLERTRSLQEQIRTRYTRFEGLIAEAKDRLTMIEDTCENPAAALLEMLHIQNQNAE